MLLIASPYSSSEKKQNNQQQPACSKVINTFSQKCVCLHFETISREPAHKKVAKLFKVFRLRFPL